MIPLKDNLVKRRLAVVTLTAMAALCVLFAVRAESFDGGAWQLAAALVFMWLFATTVEDSMGRPRFAVLCLAGFAALGVSGAVAVLLGAHARLYPGARVVGLTLIPFAVTLVEIPALALIALFVPLQAFWGLGNVAQALAGAVVGIIVIGALADRPHENPA